MSRAVASLLPLIIAAAFGQQPQATIRVEVTADSVPLPGAEVAVNNKFIRTGQDGSATTVTPLGAITIGVTKEGYFPAKASLVADAGREWVVHVELEPRKTVEEQIRVYATRNDVRIQDSPVHVEVLQREEIEEKMLMTPGDIVMMLNEMGGLRVQTTSPSLGAASVRMQGMRGRYTSFLSDGLPLFGQQGAGLGLLQIPPMDLGQVEVIKGNASALYGGAAMAGVVNLISRRPSTGPVHEFLVNRSTLGATDASMFLASRLSPHWSASLLGGGDWQEIRDVDHDGWADLAGYARGVVRPRLFWDDKNGRTALLTGGFTYENRSGGTVSGSALPATGRPYSEALNTRRYDFGGNLQWLIENRYVVTARFSATEQQHRHRFGEVVEKDRHELLFGEVSVRGSVGRNTWVAAAAAQRDAYRPTDVPRFTYTYVVPGVFVQDDFNIAHWLGVSASARADFHNRYGTFLSPRISALIRWAGFTSRLYAGQGFFAPTPLTEETEAAGLSRLALPRPLAAERGRSASIDLTRGFGGFSATTTFFASNISHPVYVDRGDAYRIFNLPAPARNRGLEMLATWHKAPFSATASYTYVRSSELDPAVGRAEVPLTPRHSFGFVGVWEKEGVSRFGVECYYTGAQRLEHNPYRGFSAPYVIFGAMGERRIAAHVKLFLNLENLGNVRQSRWDPMLLPARAVDGRWTVDAWAPLDGRVINGGVRFVF
ncbi:MAG TPA: TonB-dependent receptor [Bryobacteraceae bacterium]|jgi:iron complex outermembrane receptor protein|nr:TonB-dependent receptor [Bryobacteraceae bacterium]